VCGQLHPACHVQRDEKASAPNHFTDIHTRRRDAGRRADLPDIDRIVARSMHRYWNVWNGGALWKPNIGDKTAV
jgi:hypothetical protein